MSSIPCPYCGGSGSRAPLGPLTHRQAAVLTYIKGYIRDRGYAPTLHEICAHFGYTSLSSAHEMIGKLEAKGYLYRHHTLERGLTLLADEPAA